MKYDIAVAHRKSNRELVQKLKELINRLRWDSKCTLRLRSICILIILAIPV